MCGIAGYVGRGSPEILRRMTDAIARRGPDDEGQFVQGGVGLGHRRLSIIDLSPLGHQPMVSPDGQVIIVFNGEIYNFKELREACKKHGYPFRGGSDTEVILAHYQSEGIACFRKMNGMFAIALWDIAKQRLVLVRDRLGKKPLYWTKIDNTLLFGSELKALMAHPSFQKHVDPASVAAYLAHDYIPTPRTIFKDVYKLEPGTTLVYQDGQVHKEQFWDLSFAGEDRCVDDENGLLREMDKRLSDAVKMRLVSDVPLGVFLSGGLDSSTIAYYAQQSSREKIKTFSIGFQEKSFDESGYARQVATHLGTDHHEHMLTAKESLELIPHIADVLDEPMADYSIIPTYFLSRFTKQHVTVALGGDGGDELFLGYPTFQAERLLPLLRAGKPLLQILRSILPTSHARFNLGFKIEQLLAGLDEKDATRRHLAWMSTFRSDIRNTTYDIQDDLAAYYHDAIKKEPLWNQLIYLYMRTYLMDQVLVKVDRASMAHGLEVRAPFLDYTFVDFVNHIPYSQKIRGFDTKILLKKLMEGKLPDHIIHRKKQGFGVPLSGWLTKELKPFVTDLLSESSIRATGIFDPVAVQKIVEDHMRLKRDNRKQIWSLLVFQMWHERWMK